MIDLLTVAAALVLFVTATQLDRGVKWLASRRGCKVRTVAGQRCRDQRAAGHTHWVELDGGGFYWWSEDQAVPDPAAFDRRPHCEAVQTWVRHG